MTSQSEISGRQFVACCLTVPPGNPIDSIKPLKSVEWVKLTRRLSSIDLQPEDLLNLDPTGRATALTGTDLEADRINALLDRSGQIAIELQRWTDSGIWIRTRDDDDYPKRLIYHLGDAAPPLLFGVGKASLVEQDGIAIVGSRNVEPAGEEFAAASARSFARSGQTVISGGARGVDQIAMAAALTAGGASIGVMSDSLARRLREAEVRAWLSEGVLLLISPYRPDAGFHVGTAMGRNRLIYCLSQAAIVITTEVDGKGKGKGGTWAGAIENLRAGWVPLYVRLKNDAPLANKMLLAQTGPSGERATPLESVPVDGHLPEPLAPTATPASTRQLTLT